MLANLSEDAEHPTFERLAKRLGFDSLQAAQRSPVALIGTPSQAIEELQDRAETDGVRYVIVVSTSPETQELLADEVVPALAYRTTSIP